MPGANVKFQGKQFFSWSGDEATISGIEAEVERFAAMTLPGGSAPSPIDYATSVIKAARRSRVMLQPMVKMAMLYFVLQQDTGDPKHPGKFRDYLSTWDFEFDLTVTGDVISLKAFGGGLYNA
jgi:hypothetical protein